MMEAIGSGGRRPLAPLYGKVLSALRELPRLLASEHDELQRRWAELLDDPDHTTIGDRARARFSDFGPAWPSSVFHSPDIQIAAADVDAVERGDYLVVIGDYHPGTSPLGQGLFSYRHPNRQRFLETWGSDVGTPTIYPLPPRVAQVPLTARLMPETRARNLRGGGRNGSIGHAAGRRVNACKVPSPRYIQTGSLTKSPSPISSCAGPSAVGSRSAVSQTFRMTRF